MQGTVLVIDDNADFANFIRILIAKEGFDIHVANDARQARESIGKVLPDVVLMDIRLPDADGVQLLKELKSSHPNTQFIMMTAFGSIQSAIESMRHGAIDYLTKPFDDEELLMILSNTMKGRALKEEIRRLRSRMPEGSGVWDASSPPYPSEAMRNVIKTIASTAESAGNLLLTGESGVGKNYFARLIHRRSPRADGPFFDINCTAITPSLVESELFGHEPGAFTGSKGRKRGLLELADGGTLLLDEIGDMDPTLQSRLLTFLDTHTLRRIGGETVITVDARIIAATNRDIEALVKEGKFREDLFYRLNVLSIQLPSLRDRKEDMQVLVTELCALLGVELGLKECPEVTDEAMEKLMAHDWPGNIRELRNVLERALISSPDKSSIRDVALTPRKPMGKATNKTNGEYFGVAFPKSGLSMKKEMNELTKNLISEALKRSKTKNEAAALLGLTRYSLNHYIKSLDIHVRKKPRE